MKEQKNRPAVVLGGDVNGLGHIRSLRKMGVFTYVVCSGGKNENPACFSKNSVPVFIPKKDTIDYEAKLKNILINLAEHEGKKPVLFATSDYFVNFIATNRKVLKDYYLFNIPENDILELITNKYNVDSLVRNLGIRSPGTMKLADFHSVYSVAKTIGFPCIIKPEDDSYASAFPGKNKTASNEGELIDFIEMYPELINHIILQEIIPGPETNIFQCTAYVGKCVPTQLFTMQKIHQFPPNWGTTTLGRSTTVMTLMDKTEKILKDIGYTGFASVEYKRSEKNNHYHLIEINPRLPWYTAMFLSCGVNFPYWVYMDLNQGPELPKESIKQIDDVHWLHLRNEIAGLWKRKKSGDPVNVLKYIKGIFKARSFAFFDLYDFKPFFMAYIEFVKREFNKVFCGNDPGK